MQVSKESLVIAALLLLLALVGLGGLIAQNHPSLAPSLPVACTDCLAGCECGDCVKCLPRPVAPAVEPCKCGPTKSCKCGTHKSAPATVNVICFFCKHGFAAPANVTRTQCPNCLAPLFVQAGETGSLTKGAVPK